MRRRTEVVGTFPDGAVVIRLAGAVLLEQTDERAVRRARRMTLESVAAAMIPSSASPTWPADAPAHAGERGGPAANYTIPRDMILRDAAALPLL